MASFTNPLASFSQSTFTPDRLVISLDDVLSKKITLISGQNLARGAVLGKITASGKYALATSGAVDGSQVPDAILVGDTNATSADTEALAYYAGFFNSNALILGGGLTVSSIWEVLREKGIMLPSPPVPA